MSNTERTGTRIGFIGLGVMGLPMALNVQNSGQHIEVFDLLPAARERAEAAGLVIAPSARALIERSDVLVTMLPDTPDVERFVRDGPGLISAGRPGMIYVDMSSISPINTVELSRDLAALGIPMVDAPVSGGYQKAISGELSIMAGGDAEVLAEVRPILETMGQISAMGPSGSGQATKACNQVAVTLTIQAACEAFALGSKLGVDLELLRKALLGGSCASWILENMGPQILEGDDAPGFRVALQVKDLRIAAEAAGRTNTPLPGLATVLGLYTEALVHGQANQGNQTLSRVYERMTGAVIGSAAASTGGSTPTAATPGRSGELS